VKKSILGGLLALAIAGDALAEGPGWVYNLTVTRLVNTANGGFNVSVSPALTACTSQSGYGPNFASVWPSHAGISRIKADLLVALVTGTPVSLYLTDNTCTVGETILGGT
jgi:hypothetical protein